MSQAEEDRIRLWREERAKVAEEERAKRLAQAEADRQKRIEEAARQREENAARAAEEARVAAEKLLPSDEAVAKARKALKARIRRSRLRLVLQVLFLVLLPAAAVTYYYASVATPFYETRSVISVSKAGPKGESGLGGVLSGSASDTLKETYQTFSFINSPVLMEELEKSDNVVTRFSSGEIDPVQRLYQLPRLGISYFDRFENFVKASLDVHSGQITLNVAAPDAQTAYDIAQSTIRISADHVNYLAEELFAKRLKEAETAVSEARQGLRDAQSDLTALQIETGDLDPRARVANVLETIDALSTEAVKLTSEIDQADVAGAGDTDRARQLRDRLDLMNQRIETERQHLALSSDGNASSLSTNLLRYDLAQVEVSIAEERLTTSFDSLERARQESALGSNIFQVIVPPLIASYPTKPNLLRVLLMSLIAFGAMLSLLNLLFLRR